MPESLDNESGWNGAGPRAVLTPVLGLGTALALVVGSVIGSGIFVKPGVIAREMGDFRWILLAWVVGGVLCLFGALSLAELAAMLPSAGGVYVYLRVAYGPLIGFLFGWNEMLFGKPASTGALAMIFAGSLASGAGWEISERERVLVALVVIAAITAANIRGVRWGGWIQSLTTLVKAGFLALLALLPIGLVFAGRPVASWANYTSTFVPAAEGSDFLTRFGLVLLAVMWAYNGWHGITPVAEEIKDPSRNVVRALLLGIGLLVALYVGANIAYHGVLSMEDIAQSGEHPAETYLGHLLGPGGSGAMSVVLVLSTFGAINSDLLTVPRITFAMGRDGVFFRGLGRVHQGYGTPAIAIFTQAVMAVLLLVGSALWVELNPAYNQATVFELLTNFVIFSASLFYFLTVLAVPILRWKHPDWPRPYRTLGYPWVPIVYLLVYVWFLSEVYSSRPFEAKAGMVLIGLGIPVYFGHRALGRKTSARS